MRQAPELRAPSSSRFYRSTSLGSTRNTYGYGCCSSPGQATNGAEGGPERIRFDQSTVPDRGSTGQKSGKSSAQPDRPPSDERARVRALWKLPGLDSNQQPSG